MQNKKQFIIFIAIGIILFLAGIGLGIFYQMQNKAQVKKNEAINTMSSKIVSSITAYGQVKNINGKNILLSRLGDDMLISLLDTARIYSFVSVSGESGSKKKPTLVQKPAVFEDIKIGDNINVVLKILPDGLLEGSSAIIFPPSE